MGMRSRLFASAAFPLLSLSMVMQPVHVFAAATSVEQTSPAVQPAGTIEVAQEAAPDAPSDEEILKKRHKKQAEGGGDQQQAPAEKPRKQREPAAEEAPQQQEAPAEKPRKQREPAAEQAPQQQQQEEAPVEKPRKQKQREPAAEQPAAEPAQQQEAPAEAPRKHKQPAAEQAAPQAEPAAPQQEQVAPEQQPAENQQKPRHNKRDKQQKQQEEAAPQQQEQAAPQAEPAAPQQEQVAPEQQPSGKNGKPVAEGTDQPVKPRKKPAAEAAPEGQKPAAEQAPTQQEQPAPEKAAKPQNGNEPVTGKAPNQEQPAVGEAPAKPQLETAPAQQQGEQIAPAQPEGGVAGQPAAGQAEQVIPAPEKITPKELERRKEIAADPSKSTETVVLPVENGAAVLDSDKDADRSGGVQSRRDRDKQRGQEQQVRVPKSDADAQVAPSGERRPPIKIEAVTSEQGERLDRRPQFQRPDGAQFGQRGNDNRVIIQFNNQTYVRGDDDRRFLRDGERPMYEQLPRDRYRETIDRDGYQIVTVRNRYGDIIQRSRIDNRGRESVLYYSPELYDDPDRSYFQDPGADLPPMRLRIPLRDYIMDTSSDDDRDYYDFLREPPVEPVERVYSLDEVKYSARIRDKVRRIDLDTITFATGSAEIPMSQARSLRKVADAINEVLRKDPSETFLIEGHTDAVGSDQSNLVLSDQRAESVANVMTDVYGIPPENLATQGYGERYLKVNTQGPNQENRRVTIRRVTALVRPVASRN
ncbi:OmpA family protein [Rhizobium sp. S96]|uniref:OmpA family protein n=1 Tax=Rhizobium sp. S96 TaxID=3055140 RepID=UPI0025AAEDC4|nr:OmpA family protein [Rhizobium sp. S96]MDM9618888.1 OmpA family protein [Rhizobium sp. S96]